MTEGKFKGSAVEFSDRKHYLLTWQYPITGWRRFESSKIERSGKKQRKLARRATGKLEEKLRTGA